MHGTAVKKFEDGVVDDRKNGGQPVFRFDRNICCGQQGLVFDNRGGEVSAAKIAGNCKGHAVMQAAPSGNTSREATNHTSQMPSHDHRDIHFMGRAKIAFAIGRAERKLLPSLDQTRAGLQVWQQ